VRLEQELRRVGKVRSKEVEFVEQRQSTPPALVTGHDCRHILSKGMDNKYTFELLQNYRCPPPTVDCPRYIGTCRLVRDE